MRRYSLGWLWSDETGGGSKPQAPTFIQAPPPQITQAPPPNIQQNASDLFKAQLEYNPQLTQQAVSLQEQYAPRLAQSQTDIQLGQAPKLAQGQYDLQAQYGPLYRQLYESLFPTQTQGLENLAQQANQGMQSGTGLTGAQEAAQQSAVSQAQGLVPTQYQAAFSPQALGAYQSNTGLTSGQQTAQDQARTAAEGRVSSQFLDPLAAQALAQYQSPTGLTAEQSAAQDAIRQRAFEQSERGIRTSANLGGGLYGGNRELREDRARNELAQGFAVEDIDRQAQQRQQALQQLLAAQGVRSGIEGQRQQFGLQDIGVLGQQRQNAFQQLLGASADAQQNAQLRNQFGLQQQQQLGQQRGQNLQDLIAASQVVFPQIAQPGVGAFPAPQFGQGVTPGPDALLAAIMQGQIVQPAGFSPGIPGQPSGWAQAGGTAAGIAGAKLMFMCLPGESLIDTSDGQKPIQDIEAGEVLGEMTVLMKYEYRPEPTVFTKLVLDDEVEIEACDKHMVSGKELGTYVVGEGLQGRQVTSVIKSIRTVKTYDLLTNAPDGGYRSSSIWIPSMIPTLHRFAVEIA